MEASLTRAGAGLAAAAARARLFIPTPGRLRPYISVDAANAIRLGLTVVAALYLAMLLELQSPDWAAWTVLSVSLATRASSLQKASWRALGSIVGAVASLGLVAAFAQDTLAFDVALAMWLGLATALSTLVRGQAAYGFSLIGFTVPIITLSNVQAPLSVFDTAVDRCSTLLLGIACAHVSAALAAPGTGTVAARLSARMQDAAETCASWLRAGRAGAGWGQPPAASVLALDVAVMDAFVEQPSLQTGGRAVAGVPGALLAVLATGMLEARLPDHGGWSADRLLGWQIQGAEWRLRRSRAVAALLGRGQRIGWRRAPAQPLALDTDGRLAFNNGLRTAVAISLVNAFWYCSQWPSGGAAVTWAAIVSALLATRDNAARAALDFLLGAALAWIVGLVAHYAVLTSTGAFGLLAAVVLPIGMMAAAGRFDLRAVTSSGFGITVFTALEPLNIMQYDLASSLNSAVACLLGIGTAVLAFSALPPPASPETRRKRAKRRMVDAVRATAWRPRILLPRPQQWAAPMFQRLALVAPEGDPAIQGGEHLLLLGLLILALRRAGGAEARRVALAIVQNDAVSPLSADPLQAERAEIAIQLRRYESLGGYPPLERTA